MEDIFKKVPKIEEEFYLVEAKTSGNTKAIGHLAD
jgi:hypothetical protein